MVVALYPESRGTQMSRLDILELLDIRAPDISLGLGLETRATDGALMSRRSPMHIKIFSWFLSKSVLRIWRILSNFRTFDRKAYSTCVRNVCSQDINLNSTKLLNVSEI
uniref:Uncharacterized protein n=1 Tax=Romanomermis culicivorax TaxID=13658 RepID=A0A915JRL6_ROMCU